MSLLDRNPEAESADGQAAVIRRVIEAIEGGYVPNLPSAGLQILELRRICNAAINRTTSAHRTFVELLGEEEASGGAAALLCCLDRYWRQCQTAKELLPFLFDSDSMREMISGLLERLAKAIEDGRKGFEPLCCI